jgi:hypothetical protein
LGFEDTNSLIDVDMFSDLSLRVLFEEEGLWDLAELADRDLGCFYFILILIGCEDVVLVALVVVDVVVLLGHLVERFIPEDQVDPVMQFLTDLLAFQHFPHLEDKLLRSMSPDGEHN